jgi:hypothetical protein
MGASPPEQVELRHVLVRKAAPFSRLDSSPDCHVYVVVL